MLYDKTHQKTVIDKIVEQENKSGEMYRLGKDFKLDLEKIYEMTGIKIGNGYDPKKGITEHASDEDVINAFYGYRKNRHHKI